MVYKELVLLEKVRAEIEDKITSGDTANALTLLDAMEEKIKELKIKEVGSENIKYTYKCDTCPLGCKSILKFVPENLSYCWLVGKKGEANYLQIDQENQDLIKIVSNEL